jgi:O-acetyl-ADP-ribose deacetylase (regulator of RNase III)
MFHLDDCINNYNNNTHSNELKEKNINEYKLLISGSIQLDIYTMYKKKIKILYDCIDNYNDECFVNAANELLLGGGGIDEIVHNLGGEKLLNEIKNIPLNMYGCRLLEGEALITNGYNNKYKKFIHTVAPYYDDNNNIKPKILEKCFDSIFSIVKNNNIKSITIPAIGTGFYGFYMHEFTKICFNKVIEHLEKNKEIEQITLITNSKLQYNFYKVYNDYIHQT